MYTRHAQHTTRGPNVARGSFLHGPQTPNYLTKTHFEQGKNKVVLALGDSKKLFLARHKI